MLVHGTEDFIYLGRDDLYSAEESIRIWSSVNDCDLNKFPPETTQNKSFSAAPGVDIKTFNCTGPPLLFYKVIDGGHHWPGARFNADHFTSLNLGNFNRDFDASSAIWDFVSQHSIVVK